jgi:MFS superfamily sulfate permease-like transporter
MSNDPSAPVGDLRGLKANLSEDAISGFLVFLIALPLCLGIALASGFPAIAGVFTAVVGGLVTPWISNSELTIKGPAAGLIVIVLGAVTEFGHQYGEAQAYRMALGVGVVAGAIQVVFGLTRSGKLGDFFPTSVVHGMLAAIGVIIISKQVHVALGVMGLKGEPLELLAEIPHSVMHLNPQIALIGLTSLAILFLWPLVRHPLVRRIPAPLVVILVAVPMGMAIGLTREHTYSMMGHDYALGEKFLVSVPTNLLSAVAFPDFGALSSWVGWKWVVLFALIGSLESILSAKAVDMLDPWRRRCSLNRDLVAVGVGNMVAGSIGGLPMISEIVRSKANVDNGGRTRFANMFHALFLLGFVAFLPGLIHRIPLAALAAMLVYTGARLASPREFQNVLRIGKEQFVIFVATMMAVLATDLLVGVLIGIAVKLMIHTLNGVPLRSLFRPYLEIEPVDEATSVIRARQSAVFSNWLPFKRQIEQVGLTQKRNLVIDLSEARLVDHSVMEKLHELQEDFEQEGLRLELVGLEDHQKLSGHSLSARRRGLARIRRVTVVTDVATAERLAVELTRLGAMGHTIQECRGAGAGVGVEGDEAAGRSESLARLEVLVELEAFEGVVAHLRRQVHTGSRVVACVEVVEAVRPLPVSRPEEARAVLEHVTHGP